jgi:hypothetical protein
VTGPILQVSSHSVVLQVGIDALKPNQFYMATFYIDDDWKPRFHLLQRNKEVSVIGQIYKVYMLEIALDHGELV